MGRSVFTLCSNTTTPHESFALDSVNLANKLFALETLTAEETDRLDRNVKHLEIMVAKGNWTTENLEPLTAVINQFESNN